MGQRPLFLLIGNFSKCSGTPTRIAKQFLPGHKRSLCPFLWDRKFRHSVVETNKNRFAVFARGMRRHSPFCGIMQIFIEMGTGKSYNKKKGIWNFMQMEERI